jgi:outer membrane putative beta-barrel porin/alpha-amylase
VKKWITCGLALTVLAAIHGEGLSSSPAGDESAYETDRPGELENPFAIPPGGAEVVNYLVGMNAAAREDSFGSGGSAVFLDTAVRFGVARRLEGVVTVDSFLAANPPEGGGSGAATGFGYATLIAKWNFLKTADGDLGIALAPFVRLPLARAIGESVRSASGLVVPFDFDLAGGWEVEGSSTISRTPTTGEDGSTQWENQASLERTLTPQLTAYAELQLESGDGPPAWATEFGLTCRCSRSLRLDLGGSVGIGQRARGRFGYAGVAWGF